MIEIGGWSIDPPTLIHILIPSTMTQPFSPLKIIHNPQFPNTSLPSIPPTTKQPE